MLDFNDVPQQRTRPAFPAPPQARPPWPEQPAIVQQEILEQEEPGAVEPDEREVVEREVRIDMRQVAISTPAPLAPSRRDDAVAPAPPASRYRQVKYEALRDFIGEVARRLLGPENRDLSNREQLRFGANGSVAVAIAGPKAGTYYDHEHKRGGGVIQMLSFEGGMIGSAAYDWLHCELGIEVQNEQARKRGGSWDARIDRTYDYRDEAGALLYQVVRLKDPKDFRQRGPDGNWTVKGIRKVPFMLPQLLATPVEAPILVVEGEKDALGLHDLGLTATCNAGGAGKWPSLFAQYFAGRDVVVLPDNDHAGRDHAEQVAANLVHVARSVRILALPDLPPKGDVSDWLASGGTPEALMALATAAPLYEQPTQTQCEVLPSDHEVRDAALCLTDLSDLGEIKAVIATLAAARLGRLDEDDILEAIVKKTGRKIGALKHELKKAKEAQRSLVSAGQSTLIRDDDGEARSVLANAVHALSLSQGILGYDEFADLIMLLKRPPWDMDEFDRPRAWTDADTRWATVWVQTDSGIFINTNIMLEGVQHVAERNRFHPVRDFFDSLEWDKTPRLDTWLVVYCGAADTDYVRAIGSRWLISAVARVYEPGCKADCCLILEGNQGVGKSTAFKKLAGPKWFTDDIADLGSKDAALQTRGKLIVELAELDALSKTGVSRQKLYMSRTTDRFRPPYGRVTIEVERQYVFGGSVNDTQYLHDPTGGRRFWGAAVGKKIEINKLEDDREQIWAEAVERYRRGEVHYLDTPDLVALAAEEAASRYVPDAWEGPILKWLELTTLSSVTTADVLENALDIRDKAKWTRSDQTRVGNALRHLGWEPKQVWNGGSRERRYVPPEKQ